MYRELRNTDRFCLKRLTQGLWGVLWALPRSSNVFLSPNHVVFPREAYLSVLGGFSEEHGDLAQGVGSEARTHTQTAAEGMVLGSGGGRTRAVSAQKGCAESVAHAPTIRGFAGRGSSGKKTNAAFLPSGCVHLACECSLTDRLSVASSRCCRPPGEQGS